MALSRPKLKKIEPDFGSSFSVNQYTEPVKDRFPFWHFHPELELVYVDKGGGKRHIGNHLSYFNNSQLILIGSNLPHVGYTDRLTTNGSETIVQLKPDFLGTDFIEAPEISAINTLFERAKQGILFHRETKDKIGPKIKKLTSFKGIKRLLLLIEILNELALEKEFTFLNASNFAFEVNQQDNNRIDLIYNYINKNFTQSISLDDIADEVNMTVPSFCRYIKKVSGKTFTHIVNDYRIVHASKLLAEKPTPITDICYESGFNNFSHFNKLFKKATGKSPSQYRNETKRIISDESISS